LLGFNENLGNKLLKQIRLILVLLSLAFSLQGSTLGYSCAYSPLVASKTKEIKSKETCKPFCLVTLAKSGSHLALKAITEITKKDVLWVRSEDPHPEKKPYSWTHFCLSPQLRNSLQNRKVIVLVRDLRDLCISATHALHADITQWKKSPKICDPNFKNLSFADQLSCVIREECQMQPEDPSLIWNFSNSFPQAAALIQDPKVLVCRYENLVGPDGGGSLKAQYLEIQRIADYLEIPITSNEIRRIASAIYGDSWTFRKGQIEEWKKLFTPNHKALFKEKFSSYLIALGYEQDHEW
jgi:hypothetical protein